MRRTTLGPLTGSDLNSSLDTSIVSVGDGRKSLSVSAIGKLSSKAAPTSAKKVAPNRQSIAPAGGADNRRMSLAAPMLIKKRDVDPRPVASRKWQEQETEALLAFLEACGYNQHLTKQLVLQGLNTKDFSQMFNFLLRGFDTAFVINGKVETEVTDVIKALHYPFPPSKTALSAIGAQHSWPAFLGLLSWLRELLQYDRAVQLSDQQHEAAIGNVPGSSAHFWGYLQVVYTHYLAGSDDEVAGVENNITATFDALQLAEEDEEARLKDLAVGLLGQLQRLQAQKTTLPTARAHAVDLDEDVSRLKASMGQVEAYETELGKKVEAKKRSVLEAEAEVGTLREELDRVSASVAHQELSQEDVRRLRSNATALRDRADLLAHRKTGAVADIEGLKANLRDSLAALDSALHDYHESARGLQMVPKGAKYSMGTDFSLRVEERALAICAEAAYGSSGGDVRAAAYALLGADMKAGVKEKIRYLKGLLLKKATESRSAIMVSSDSVAELHAARTAVGKALQDAIAAGAAAEDSGRREAEALEARLKDGAAEISKAESAKGSKRSAALSAAASRAELSPAVLGELEASIDHMAAAQAGDRARLVDAISRLIMRVEEHRRTVAGKITACAANGIAFKDGMRLAEAERAARLAAPISLTATPAAASASIAAGASMLLASSGLYGHSSMGMGASAHAASPLSTGSARDAAAFMSPAAAAKARHANRGTPSRAGEAQAGGLSGHMTMRQL